MKNVAADLFVLDADVENEPSGAAVDHAVAVAFVADIGEAESCDNGIAWCHWQVEIASVYILLDVALDGNLGSRGMLSLK